MLSPRVTTPLKGTFRARLQAGEPRATGCVRVENTLALAALLLQEPGSGGADIGRLTHGEYLPTLPAVFIVHQTVSVGLGGSVLRINQEIGDQLKAYPPLSASLR